jgi:uncharacterized membrane protein YjfL (UPF0719 family)
VWKQHARRWKSHVSHSNSCVSKLHLWVWMKMMEIKWNRTLRVEITLERVLKKWACLSKNSVGKTFSWAKYKISQQIYFFWNFSVWMTWNATFSKIYKKLPLNNNHSLKNGNIAALLPNVCHLYGSTFAVYYENVH